SSGGKRDHTRRSGRREASSSREAVGENSPRRGNSPLIFYRVRVPRFHFSTRKSFSINHLRLGRWLRHGTCFPSFTLATFPGGLDGHHMISAAPHVSVWLEEPSLDEGVLAHALEWASRLGWPLRTLPVTERQTQTGDGSGQNDLYILDEALPAALKEELLQRVLRLPRAGSLLCPRGCPPARPAPVGVRARRPGRAFLG